MKEGHAAMGACATCLQTASPEQAQAEGSHDPLPWQARSTLSKSEQYPSISVYQLTLRRFATCCIFASSIF